MPETVRQKALVSATPEINIEVSSTLGPFSYNSGLASYNPADAFYVASGDNIDFDSSVTFPFPATYAVDWEWDFGDGATDTGQSVSHRFRATGSVQVSLTVVDNLGRRWRSRRQVYVKDNTLGTQLRSLDPSLYWGLDRLDLATDLSGNGRDGTAAGGILVGQSPSSPLAHNYGSTEFGDTNDAITSSYNPFTNGTSRTFFMYLRRNDGSAIDVAFEGPNANGPRFRFEAGSDDVKWFPNATGSATTWTAPDGTLAYNQYALVFNETTNAARFYQHGNLVSSQSNATPYHASPGNLQLGVPLLANVLYFAVFEYALADDQIAALAVANDID
jgi:hypothetical protein